MRGEGGGVGAGFGGRGGGSKVSPASIAGEWQAVQIMRAGSNRVADLRPLVRLNISVVVERNGRRETGSYGTGGRFAYDQITVPTVWRNGVDEALRQALVNLDSVPAPAGEMEVVLGPGLQCQRAGAQAIHRGWTGISAQRF